MSVPDSARGSRALVFAAALALLLSTAFGYFRADDWTNLERGRLALSGEWRQVWTAVNPFGFFRPLVDTWHGVMLGLWGLNPWPHLLPLVLLLALQTLLLARLVRLRGGSAALAWLAAAAAWAQVNTYAWTALWPSNVTGSLMTTFLLLAFTLHHRAVRFAGAGRGAATSVGLAALAAALALLCKEEAVLMPPVLAWLEALRWRRLRPRERGVALSSWTAITLVVAFYAAFRLLVLPGAHAAGERYALHFGLNWARNLAFFAAHLGALPLVAALLTRLFYPAAWRPGARRGSEWLRSREGMLAGAGWAAIGIQLYLPIGGHAYGYLYAPAFAVAFAVAHFVEWAAGVQSAADGRAPAPSRVVAAHWTLALLATAAGLYGAGWHRYGAIAREAFAVMDRTLPRPRPGAHIVFLDPLERETLAGRSLFNMVFDTAPGSLVRLHYRRADLTAEIVAGDAALAATERPPAADAVYLARDGRLSLLAARDSTVRAAP